MACRRSPVRARLAPLHGTPAIAGVSSSPGSMHGAILWPRSGPNADPGSVMKGWQRQIERSLERYLTEQRLREGGRAPGGGVVREGAIGPRAPDGRTAVHARHGGTGGRGRGPKARASRTVRTARTASDRRLDHSRRTTRRASTRRLRHVLQHARAAGLDWSTAWPLAIDSLGIARNGSWDRVFVETLPIWRSAYLREEMPALPSPSDLVELAPPAPRRDLVLA